MCMKYEKEIKIQLINDDKVRSKIMFWSPSAQFTKKEESESTKLIAKLDAVVHSGDKMELKKFISSIIGTYVDNPYK